MDKEEIIKKMKGGWDLKNRGNDWYLSEPLIAYGKTQSLKVKGPLVKELEEKGIIKINIPYKTIIAKLA